MNIFFLSMSIKRCARAHFDKHVIKMILEYTQLLSTAYQLFQPSSFIYKPTHINHPCSIWVRQHINNYNYVLRLANQLCNEWRYRYQHDKIHACESKLLFLSTNKPPLPCYPIDKNKHNPKSLAGPLPQAMPEDCKQAGHVHACVLAYRKYYQSPYKKHLRQWKRRDAPRWFNK